MSERDDRLVHRLQTLYPPRDSTASLVEVASGPTVTEPAPPSEQIAPLQCQACPRLFPQGGKDAWQRNVGIADACRRFTCPMRGVLARLRPDV